MAAVLEVGSNYAPRGNEYSLQETFPEMMHKAPDLLVASYCGIKILRPRAILVKIQQIRFQEAQDSLSK